MKRALVCDWLIDIGGAEKTFEEIWKIYPSPIYALLRKGIWEGKEIRTSFLQKIPFATRFYRDLLPLFPSAIERLDLKEYDLILSCSHSAAKGILKREDQLHICYCYTPMRYIWEMHSFYFNQMNPVKALAAKLFVPYLRQWDVKSSQRVDHFIADSHHVARRIKRIYGRDSTVIYPPVATHLFTPKSEKDSFYFTASRLVPYKKVDLIVEAFSHMPDKKLLVAGDGPEMKKIKAKARANVEILGHLPDNQVRELLEAAKAFVFAAEEDFGIGIVEAQAAGTPVIAFGRGGALEILVKDETGIFFEEQTVHSLISAIERFEKKEFDSSAIRKNSLKFSAERFKSDLTKFIEAKINESRHSRRR